VRLLVLDAKAVEAACPMGECIGEMSRAFRLQAEGGFQTPLRTRISAQKGDILIMPSLAKGERPQGSVKMVSIFPRNTGKTPSLSALVLLVDGESGEPKAILEGRTLTAIRTGAVSGLSCKYLARKDSRTLGMVGAGGQAFRQVAGVSASLPAMERVRIYSRRRERSKALARGCKKLGLQASVEETVDACVRESDVVVTATTSSVPVFEGSLVREGTHVIAIGSYRPEARELDSALVSRASIFVDSREAALEEAGDLLIPMSEGVIPGDSIRADLSELVSGRRKGRTSRSEVTIFKSVGLAFEDNAAGWLTYRRALRLGMGKNSEI
jgi:ornithine cyclodeaminase/alanine dehydrogenase-like protein (mu-crystallin family)